MKSKLFAAAGALLLSSNAFAGAYFVQPIINVSPGAFINGLETNGAKFRQEGFNNAPTSVNSIVDLNEGTIRGNVTFGTATGLGGSSQGRFGEQVTFHNGTNTNWDFDFTFEGDVFADARDANLNSLLQIEVHAYMAIFDSSVGANSSTWFDLAFGPSSQALFKDRINYNFTNPTEEVDEFISDSISGSLLIPAGPKSYDIFANLTLIVAKNNNPVNANLDFRNTALFSITTAPGVTYTSLSGTFLDSTGVTPVPSPAGLPVMAAGALALLLRKRRTR
jgi:hypothetical protein